MSLELRGIRFTYLPGTPMAREVLKGMDMELQPGEILCLMGRTGAGKSTLLRVTSGLLAPTAGEVILNGGGTNGSQEGSLALRKAVGMLIQSPHKQLFAETVQKDVAFGPRNQGLRGEELAERVRESLLAVGLDPKTCAHRSPFLLSEGEMRRAAMAGVLAIHPDYLLLDEPFAGLDLPGRGMLHRTLQALREQGKGILLATHDWEEVVIAADRVLLLHEGGIAFSGRKEEVMASLEELERVGLRPPPLIEILARLRRRGWDLPPYASSPVKTAALIAAAVKGGAQ